MDYKAAPTDDESEIPLKVFNGDDGITDEEELSFIVNHDKEEEEIQVATARTSEESFTNEETDRIVEGRFSSVVEEVNLTVPGTDNVDLPSLTVRTWVLGLPVCVILAFVNQFFYFRSSPIVISALAGQILSLHAGRAMAKWVPKRKIGPVDLNPGPFNIKEHVLITVFAGCGSAFGRGEAGAMQLVTLLKIPAYFHLPLSVPVALMLVLTTQTLGYGLAGLLRKFLVDPPQMWWPSTMVDVALFRALHEKESHKGLSRLQFFGIATGISFAWYLLPDYIFATVTSLSWVCWVWKDSVTAHQYGSGVNGLGLFSVGVDWATISAYLYSPLATPWFTLVNVYIGFLIAAFVITPICYHLNVYDAKSYPIVSNRLFLENGRRYNTTKVLGDGGLYLDRSRYDDYGPPQLATSYVIIHWGLVFAYITSAFTHVFLWNGKEIYRRFMSSRRGASKYTADIHTRLMLHYPDIPYWWFLILLMVNVVLALFLILAYPDTFQLTPVLLVVAILFSIIFTLPVGVITATTNQFEGPGALSDFLYGYLDPGRVVGLNSFRVYAAGSVVQSVIFLRDFKLAHYMKIPPRSMFLIQIVGTIVAGVVNVACAFWLFETEPNLCKESGSWSCPSAINGHSVATIWGLIGTKRMFGSLGKYKAIPWMFLVGALAPIPFWGLTKVSPRLEFFKWVHTPVLLSAAKPWPPASPVNFNSWFLTGFIFQFVVFRYYRPWWTRYNYVLSAALDTGVAMAGPLVYIALQISGQGGLNWWGNPEQFVDHCPLAVCPTAKGINVTDKYPACPIFS